MNESRAGPAVDRRYGEGDVRTEHEGLSQNKLLVYVFGPKNLANPTRRLWDRIVAIFGKYRSIPSKKKKLDEKSYFFMEKNDSQKLI